VVEYVVCTDAWDARTDADATSNQIDNPKVHSRKDDNSKIVSSHPVDSKEVVKTSLVNLMSYCRSLLSVDNPVLFADKIGLSTDNPVIGG
jgi:hypothetical protein